ncbi:hypothetical protein JXA48_01980 [Candidatus Woesearchaeota archaeon]|nr:hypothetical protein [Candidatus Woesearchaeota archaeon]
MNKYGLLALILTVLIISTSIAIAAPTGGLLTILSTERGSDSEAQSFTTQGGNVTEATIVGRVITDRWAGFYGSATGQIFAGDGSGNTYFQWTTVDMTDGVIYASDGQVNDWLNLRPAVVGDMPGFVQGVATDNFAATFSSTEVFDSASLTIPATPYALSWQNISGTAGVGNLRTYALHDDSDGNNIFAGKIIDDAASFAGGETVDYQIIVPAQTAVDTTYWFYLEMP